ncbi:hypothetical protein T484DRAFT_1882530, partial [Baffinella frigidus]
MVADCAIRDIIRRKLDAVLGEPTPPSGSRDVKLFLCNKKQTRGSNRSPGVADGTGGALGRSLAGHMTVDELWELGRIGYDAQGRAQTLKLVFRLVDPLQDSQEAAPDDEGGETQGGGTLEPLAPDDPPSGDESDDGDGPFETPMQIKRPELKTGGFEREEAMPDTAAEGAEHGGDTAGSGGDQLEAVKVVEAAKVAEAADGMPGVGCTRSVAALAGDG